MRKIALGWTLAALLGTVAPARAADEIHWTLTGETSVTFDWRGPESVIQYGLTPAYGQQMIAHTPSPAPWSSPGPFWEAPITGLLPDHVYHYSVGGGPDHTFRTMPAPGTSNFSIYVEGDIGSTRTFWRVGAVQALIANDPPRFVLPVGDLTYANAHGQEEVDQFFNDVMVWSQDAAFMPAWGNHEYETDSYTDDLRNYKGRVDLPNAHTSPGVGASSCCGEDWYWFDYGNVRFIAYPEPTVGAWAEWVPHADSLMAQAQADPAIGFIVTFGHRPAYSSGNHPGSPSLKGYLDGLGAKYSKYKLNLNGHSHDYERSYPQNGVVHITAGGGGANLEEENASCRWKGGCPAPTWSAFRAYHHGAVKITFTTDAIKIEAICGPPGDTGSNINDITCTPGSVFDSVSVTVDAPTAHIDTPAQDVAISAGDSVYFTGTASDADGDLPLAYSWDFGGGAPNVQVEDPGYVVFHAPGVYRVTFAAADSSGETDPTPDTRTVTVGQVNHPPDGQILQPAGPITVVEGQTVTFAGAGTDPDGGPLTYSWNFDDGAPNVQVQNPGPVTFNLNGSFIVSLTVTDSAGLSDPTPAEIEVTVTPPDLAPVAQIVAPDTSMTIAPGDSVRFQGSVLDEPGESQFAYQWDFGGGAPNANVMSPGYVRFIVPGSYTVTFTATDLVDGLMSQPATRVIDVTVNQIPIATLEVAPATGNAPLSTLVNAGASYDPDGAIASYLFDFGDGSVAGPTSNATQSHTYVAGSYSAQVTVTDNRGGQRSVTMPVVVAPVTPGINFVTNPSVETNLSGWAAYGGASLTQVPGGFDGHYAMELDGPTVVGQFGLNDSPNWVDQTSTGNVGHAYRFSAWVRSPHSTGRARLQIREFQGQTRLATTWSPYLTLSPSWQFLTVDHTVNQAGTTLDFMVLDNPVAPSETLIVDNLTAKSLDATTGVEPLAGATQFAALLTPNPMHAAGTLHLALPRAGAVRVEVLDLSGRRVCTLLDEAQMQPGVHHVRFDAAQMRGGRLASGVYFYRVTSVSGTFTRRFAILR